MARHNRPFEEKSNVLPFKRPKAQIHWLNIVNTLLLLGLYLILLGK